MVTKLIRRDRDNNREIRGGVRGGKDQFKWDDIRDMSYKERECYLGYTTKIGYLDKGGKWRKGDWYKNVKRHKRINKTKFSEAKKQDEERMQIALGLKKKPEEEAKVPMLSGKSATNLMKRIRDSDNSIKAKSEPRFGLGFLKKPGFIGKNKIDLEKNYYKLEGNINKKHSK